VKYSIVPGFLEVEVIPLPKLQLQLVAPVELSENMTCKGLQPLIEDALMPATCACAKLAVIRPKNKINNFLFNGT
jgi:hypothetical protein